MVVVLWSLLSALALSGFLADGRLAPPSRARAAVCCDAATPDDEMTLRRRNEKKPPKDNRDKLLYSVRTVTPPPADLGLFRLDAKAACGDILEYRDRVYIIQRVQYLYAYQGGAYRMNGKAALVKEASRDAVESYMQRMVQGSSSLSIDDDGVAPFD
jgi:hypothetical protein